MLIEPREKKKNQNTYSRKIRLFGYCKVFRTNVTAASFISAEEKVVILRFYGKLQESFYKAKVLWFNRVTHFRKLKLLWAFVEII